MDIYFCDLCGIRVTDADLRAGHGLRDDHDVICSNCLELGHHKEWLNRRVKAKVGPTPGPAAKNRETEELVATLDDEPPFQFPPQASESTPSQALPVLPEDHTATASVPSPERPSEMPLAGAASLFSALSAQPSSAPDQGHEDDLLDQADQPPVTTTPEPEASPFSPFSEEVSDSDEKAETAIIPTTKGEKANFMEEKPATGKTKPADKGKTGAAAPSRPKTEVRKSTSSRLSKPDNKGRSSRRGPAGKDTGSMIMMGSYISLALIVLAFGGVFAYKKGWVGSKHTRTATGIDGDEIKSMIRATKTVVVDALQSEDKGKLQAARAEIERTQSAIDTFEKTAIRSGNSEDQINHFLEREAGWNDVYMLKRNVNDMLQKMSH